MKTFRKIVALFIASCISISSFCLVAFADESGNYRLEKGTSILLDSGFTLEEINFLFTPEQIMEYSEVKPAAARRDVYIKMSTDDKTGETIVTEIPEQICMQSVSRLREERDQALKNASLGIETYANNSGGSHDDLVTSDGYMRMIVSAYEYAGEEDVYKVAGQFIWLISPAQRHVDVVGVGHQGNLTQLGKSSDYHFSYTADLFAITGGVKSEIGTHRTSHTNSSTVDDGGTAVSFQLYQDQIDATIISAENHRITLSYDAKVNDASTTYSAVYADYAHQKLGLTVSPSLSYPMGSVGVSINTTSIYSHMTPNAYASFAC